MDPFGSLRKALDCSSSPRVSHQRSSRRSRNEPLNDLFVLVFETKSRVVRHKLVSEVQ